MGGLRAKIMRSIGRGLPHRRSLNDGFTLIEVLIVLAVTGFLFVGAAIMIAGRQARTEFDQGARQIQSQMQQIINEVAIGFYPNLNTFRCTAGPSGPVLTAGSGTQQGANTGCIFLGKAVQFRLAGTDPEQFVTYTIAGLQKASSGTEVTSLGQARPKVVAPNVSEQNIPDVSVPTPLQGGLTTVDNGMRYYDGATWTQVGAIAFVTTLASYSSGGITSGSQQVNLIGINGSSLGQTKPQAASAINSYLATNPSPAQAAQICFVSAGTDQSALITIGGGGRQLSVILDIKSNKTCA